MQRFFQAANAMYLHYPALWEEDFDWKGFQWLSVDDYQGNCVAFLRRDSKGNPVVVLCNFSPVHREGYRLGVPVAGRYECILNSDEERFGGTGLGNREQVGSEYIPCHDQEQSITVDLPPMSAMIFRCARKFPVRKKETEKEADKPAVKVEAPKRGGRKPKAEAVPAEASAEAPKRRGRKPKAEAVPAETPAEAPKRGRRKPKAEAAAAEAAAEAPKRRGRKPKAEAAPAETPAEAPKRRGRKPKAEK